MSVLPPDSEFAILQCPGCRSPLKVGRRVESLEEPCPVCRAAVHLTMFPRLFGDPVRIEEAIPVSENEASCSFFPELRAEKVCDECGAFVSHRAAISWGGRDLCLPCLHRLREITKEPDYIGRTLLNDRRALALVTWLVPLSLFTAPIALYLLLRYRGKPEGFVPRGRGVWWTAFSLALIELIGWLVLIVVWISLMKDSFS